MPACTALLPPSLQGHFLAAYTERATALEAEREGLKQHLREAHRQASCGQSSLATFRANGEPLGAPGAAETAASCRCCLPPGSPALTFPVLGSRPPPPLLLQANLAQAKIKRLQEALADAQGHKEASSRRHGPPPPLPASICRLPGQLGRRRPCSV
jgi:hypothetical protein